MKQKHEMRFYIYNLIHNIIHLIKVIVNLNFKYYYFDNLSDS